MKNNSEQSLSKKSIIEIKMSKKLMAVWLKFEKRRKNGIENKKK